MRRAVLIISMTVALLASWALPAGAHPDNCLFWIQWPVHEHFVCF